MDRKVKIPELELKILQVLWKLGDSSSVQEVIDDWAPKPAPGYTTVLKKLQIMEKKGLVVHEKAGRAFKYHPTLTRDEVSHSRIEDMLSTLFQGNRLDMVGAFFSGTDLSADELSEIRKMLDQREQSDD